LLDSTDHEICKLIDNEQINGAPVAKNANGQYVSSGIESSRIDILIDQTRWEAFQNASKVRVKAGLSTTSVASVQKARVAIKETDVVEFKLRALVHPGYHISIPLVSENDQEGGEQ
jgi:hypothetical protein